MLVLFFSGTGNSAYIAQNFAQKMQAACHSIEDEVDFTALLAQEKTIALCFPVYGSCVPRIMQDFIARYFSALRGKNFIIFCTQMVFSGDGAKALARLLPRRGKTVLYAEHFSMPNNISNFKLFPIREAERARKLAAADKKLNEVCADIQQGIIKRRGWGLAAGLLGMLQNTYWPAVEKQKRGSFHADGRCNNCGLCVKLCPVQNLTLTPNGPQQQNNCILCYRCVNACPQKAISVLLNAKPKAQYKGPV